jgi:hypothetical protein
MKGLLSSERVLLPVPEITSQVAAVQQWQMRLGIQHLRARLEAVHPSQVTGENGLPGADLVGVIIETGGFTIVHTRPLRVDDVVHELLHVLCPHWRHEEVELWTARLVAEPRRACELSSQNRTLSSLGKETSKAMLNDYRAFNLRTRKHCTILNPEIVTMKNGRKAVQGTASDDGKTKVFRILGAQETEGLSKS